jgi:hypothetical protein
MPADNCIIDFSHPGSKRLILNYLRGLKGVYWVEVRRCRDQQRSSAQNRFFNGPVLFAAMKAMNEFYGGVGEWDQEACKCFFKEKFLRQAVFDRETGEQTGSVIRSTADLDVGEFCEFLNSVILWCRENLGTDFKGLESPVVEQEEPLPSF